MDELLSVIIGVIVVIVGLIAKSAAQKRKIADTARGAQPPQRPPMPKTPLDAPVYQRYVSEHAGALEVHKKSDYAPHLGAYAGEGHEDEYKPNLGAFAGEGHEPEYTPNMGLREGDTLYGETPLARRSGAEVGAYGGRLAEGPLFSAADARRGVIMREILDRPRALRPRARAYTPASRKT